MNRQQHLQQFIDQQLMFDHADFFAEIDIGRQQIERGECVHLETEDAVREFFAEIKRGRTARSELQARRDS